MGEQRQDSLAEQLFDLASFATHEGMYDAADWILRQLTFTLPAEARSAEANNPGELVRERGSLSG